MSKSIYVLHDADGPYAGIYRDRESAEADSDETDGVVEYAPVERHPGSEPPSPFREVLGLYGDEWRVTYHDGANWMAHTAGGVLRMKATEWLDLPPIREPGAAK